MRNEAILRELYTPNDRLGVAMFGATDWARCKGRVCGLTNAMIDRQYTPQHDGDMRYNALFEVLFAPNRKKFAEMLGADAPIDFIPGDLARGVSKIGSGFTNMLNRIPFFTPWIAGGREINEGTAKFLKWLGLSSQKAEETAPTVVKAGLTVGGVLLIGGAIYGVYYLSKKKKRR